MINMKIKGFEITLKNEKWKCENKYVEKILSQWTYRDIEIYSPFPDLSLAELVVKKLGGKIIGVIGTPKLVGGRTY